MNEKKLKDSGKVLGCSFFIVAATVASSYVPKAVKTINAILFPEKKVEEGK